MNILMKLIKFNSYEIQFCSSSTLKSNRLNQVSYKSPLEVIHKYRVKMGCDKHLNFTTGDVGYRPESINFISSMDEIYKLDKPVGRNHPVTIKDVYRPIIYITNEVSPSAGTVILKTDKIKVYAVGGNSNNIDCIIYSGVLSLEEIAKEIVKDDGDDLYLNELYINKGYYSLDDADFNSYCLRFLIESDLTQKQILDHQKTNILFKDNIDLNKLLNYSFNRKQTIIISKYGIIEHIDEFEETSSCYLIPVDDSKNHLKVKNVDGDVIKGIVVTKITLPSKYPHIEDTTIIILSPDTGVIYKEFIKLIANELLNFIPKGSL